MIKRGLLFLLIYFTSFFTVMVNLQAEEIKDGRILINFAEKYKTFSFSWLEQLGGRSYLPLIFADDPRTSKFNLLINNQVHTPAEDYQYSPLFSRTSNGGQYTWTSKQLEIQEELDFLSAQGSPVSDGILIRFTLKNISSQRLTIGLRYIIDTYLGEDGDVHFYDEYGAAYNSETGFTASNAPRYLVSPKDGDRNKGLMIMLRSPGITLPDQVTLANWKRLSDSAWEYQINTTRNFSRPPYSINDSAVLLSYKPEALNPGSSRTVTIAMGYYAQGGYSPELNEGTEKIGNLVASLSDQENNGSEKSSTPEEELAAVRELIKQIDDILQLGEDIPEEKMILLQQLMDTLKSRQENFLK